MRRYDWWAHRRTATIFAVRLEDGCVTGVCGPLELYLLPDAMLPGLDYTVDSAAACRAREHPDEFVLAEPFLRGHPVPVRSAPAPMSGADFTGNLDHPRHVSTAAQTAA